MVESKLNYMTWKMRRSLPLFCAEDQFSKDSGKIGPDLCRYTLHFYLLIKRALELSELSKALYIHWDYRANWTGEQCIAEKEDTINQKRE